MRTISSACARTVSRRRPSWSSISACPRTTVMGLRKSWASMPAMAPRAAMRSLEISSLW